MAFKSLEEIKQSIALATDLEALQRAKNGPRKGKELEMADDFKSRLAALKRGNVWDEAKQKAATGGFDLFPKGKYNADITQCEVTESGAGRLQVTWAFTVTEGEQAGNTCPAWDSLEDPQKLPFMLRKFRTLGYDVSQLDPDDVPGICEAITARRPNVRINVAHNEGKGDNAGTVFQNIYIDRVNESLTDEDVQPQRPSTLETAARIVSTTVPEETPSAIEGPPRAEGEFLVGETVTFIVKGKPMKGIVEQSNGDELIVLSGGEQFVVGSDACQLAA